VPGSIKEINTKNKLKVMRAQLPFLRSELEEMAFAKSPVSQYIEDGVTYRAYNCIFFGFYIRLGSSSC
jgi:hypothetical protein